MKKFFCFILIFCNILGFLFCFNVSVFASSPEPVQTVTSDDNIVQKLYNMVFSYMGVVNKSTDLISNASNSISNSVKELIASAFNGGGIYIDSNGDYVFSDSTVNDIYDALNSNSSVDARVISDFSNFSYNTDSYVNSDFLLKLNSLISYLRSEGNGNYLLVSSRSVNGSYISTRIDGYLLSNNFGYLGFTKYSIFDRLSFFNNSASNSSFLYKTVSCSYDVNLGTYNVYYSNNISSSNYIDLGSYYNFDNVQNNSNPLTKDIIYNSLPNINLADLNFKLINVSIYCNNSIIIAKDSSSGNGLLNQSTGIFYNSLDERIFNKTIVENNNWESIYNNYVYNVNEDFQNDKGITAAEFRKIQKKYTDSIITAINSGSTDIENSISLTNRWLKSIDSNVSAIYDYISSNSGGSGGSGVSSSWTSSDVTNTLNYLDNISSNSDYMYRLNELANLSTYLQIIVNKMNRDEDIYIDLKNTPTADIVDQMVDFKDVVFATIQNAVPFCYVGLFGVLIDSLSEDPVIPHWEIPFKTTIFNIDESIVIDFQKFAVVHSVLIALQCILFIILLIFATFKLVEFTTNFFMLW